MRILVVDDEKDIITVLQVALSGEGYAVDAAVTGEEGESLAESIPYDLIILDIVLPKKNGIEVCKSLRRKNIMTPVILLTSKRDELEVQGLDRGADEIEVQGLDSGADEFMVKPFHVEVLFARVRALLRREPKTDNPRIEVGNLVLDTTNRQVWNGKAEVELTKKEYAILEYLVHHRNAISTREQLEQHAWNLLLDTSSNIVDEHIKNLRKKLGTGAFIETVRGTGYRLNV